MCDLDGIVVRPRPSSASDSESFLRFRLQVRFSLVDVNVGMPIVVDVLLHPRLSHGALLGRDNGDMYFRQSRQSSRAAALQCDMSNLLPLVDI